MSIAYILEALFAFIASLLPLLVIIFVISRIAKVSKMQQGQSGQRPASWSGPGRSMSSPIKTFLTEGDAERRQRKLAKSLQSSKSGEYKAPETEQLVLGKGAKTSSLAETFMKDDRQHDWLARQMREEEKILRRGDMLDLGASHSSRCDADMLKKYHLYAEHDDSVDSGEY